jgi:uncharacterized protein (PEP-CTERM system associated)
LRRPLRKPRLAPRRAALHFGWWPATLVLALAQPALAEPYVSTMRSRFAREVEKVELQPGLYLEPRIESALMLVGNINLAEDSADEVDVAGVEVSPGLYASYSTPRAVAALDYTFVGRAFEEDAYDDVSHRLAANGSYDLLPDWAFVRGQASYTDTIIDPELGYNYGGSGLFNETNLVETAAASIEPGLHHEFRHVVLDARYTYGRVWYLEDDDNVSTSPIFAGYNDDSENQRALLSLSSVDPGAATSLRGFYEWQASDFERSLRYRYERAGAEFTVRLAESLQFVADGGAESDLDEDTTDGGLDTEFWHAGFIWRPDSRTSLDARYGERFFGDSWSASLSRETRWVTIKASYIEDPEVETRRLNQDFDPGGLPIPDPGEIFSRYSAFPYVRKDAVASLIAAGARTKLRLDFYDRKREYINVFPPDERTTGVRFNALRDLGSELYLEFDARYDDIERGRRTLELEDLTVTRDYDREAMLRVNWEAYRNFIASAEAGYLSRSGDREYDGQWFAARFRYTF